MNTISPGETVEIDILFNWSPNACSGIEITKAWLPMKVLDGVKLTVESRRSMSVMEKFAAEALLTLNAVRPIDLQEIASIPEELAMWLFASLEQEGLARRKEDIFEPQIAQCTQALKQGAVSTTLHAVRDILWFPETDEVVVLDDATPFLRGLSKLMPEQNYPLPSEQQGQTRIGLLTKPLNEGRFYGGSAAAVRQVTDSKPVEDKKCPAYRCTTILPDDENSMWSLTISGPRKARSSTEGPKRSDIEVPVPRLQALTNSWRQRIAASETGVKSKLHDVYGLAHVNFATSGIRAQLTGEQARTLAQTQLLSDTLGLQVRIADELEYILPLKLSPSDGGAEKLFEMDRHVRQLLSSGDTLTTATDISMQEVRGRLWELGLYKPLYDLREVEDFAL